MEWVIYSVFCIFIIIFTSSFIYRIMRNKYIIKKKIVIKWIPYNEFINNYCTGKYYVLNNYILCRLFWDSELKLFYVDIDGKKLVKLVEHSAYISTFSINDIKLMED